MKSRKDNPYNAMFDISVAHSAIFYIITEKIYNINAIYVLTTLLLFIQNLFLCSYITKNFSKFEQHNKNVIQNRFRNKYTEVIFSILTLVVLLYIIIIIIFINNNLLFINTNKARKISLGALLIVPFLYSSAIKLIINTRK